MSRERIADIIRLRGSGEKVSIISEIPSVSGVG